MSRFLQGGGVVATTTDTQRDLDDAARGQVRSERQPSFVYTEMTRAEPEQDGTIEHNDPKIVTDIRPREPVEERLQNMAVPLTPGQEAAAAANYQVQLLAARGAIPDFDEVVNQPDVNIPAVAAYMIQRGGLPNGPMVAYHLAKHRQECERLMRMTPKAAQARIVELSAKYATDGETAGLDTADYRTFRRIRNSQVRNLHG